MEDGERTDRSISRVWWYRYYIIIALLCCTVVRTIRIQRFTACSNRLVPGTWVRYNGVLVCRTCGLLNDCASRLESGAWNLEQYALLALTLAGPYLLRRTRSPARISLAPTLAALLHSVTRKKAELGSATSRVPKSTSKPALEVICCSPLVCSTSTNRSRSMSSCLALPERRRVWMLVIAVADLPVFAGGGWGWCRLLTGGFDLCRLGGWPGGRRAAPSESWP